MFIPIAAFALGLQNPQALPLPEAGPTDAEIIVIGRRMKEVRVTLGRHPDGKIVCAATVSSGYQKIDAMICKDSAACLKRRRVTTEQIHACVDERRPRLIKKIQRQMKAGRR